MSYVCVCELSIEIHFSYIVPCSIFEWLWKMVTHFEIAKIGFSIFDIGSNMQCVQCSVYTECTHFRTFIVIFVSILPSALGSEKISEQCYSYKNTHRIQQYKTTQNQSWISITMRFILKALMITLQKFHFDSTFVQNVTHKHHLICVDKTGLPLLKGFTLHVYSISVCYLDLILLS